MTTSAPTTRKQFLTSAFVQQLIDMRPTGEDFDLAIQHASINPTHPGYFREWRTVWVGSYRQSGKSRSIVEMADEQSWIFAINLAQRDDLIERLQKLGKMVSPQRVFTSGDMKNFTFAHGLSDTGVLDKDIETFGKPKRVFVDDASFFFERFSQKEFYKQLCPRLLPETDFVLLG